jgi:hypothetical protein
MLLCNEKAITFVQGKRTKALSAATASGFFFSSLVDG